MAEVKVRNLHRWDLSTAEAQALQARLAGQVVGTPTLPERVRWVAGLDLSPPDAEGQTVGAVVVLTYPDLAVREVKRARVPLTFPYIPGLLAFREAPALVRALERTATEADVLMVDGHGIAHPRRFGIACHIGLLADRPTVGVAKSILVGRHDPLQEEAGAWVPLVDRGEVVGAVVRTRTGVRPVYVSIGHRVDLETAVRLVLACTRGHRLPEPTRLAHLAAAGRLPEQDPPPEAGEQGRLFSTPGIGKEARDHAGPPERH